MRYIVRKTIFEYLDEGFKYDTLGEIDNVFNNFNDAEDYLNKVEVAEFRNRNDIYCYEPLNAVYKGLDSQSISKINILLNMKAFDESGHFKLPSLPKNISDHEILKFRQLSNLRFHDIYELEEKDELCYVEFNLDFFKNAKLTLNFDDGTTKFRSSAEEIEFYRETFSFHDYIVRPTDEFKKLLISKSKGLTDQNGYLIGKFFEFANILKYDSLESFSLTPDILLSFISGHPSITHDNEKKEIIIDSFDLVSNSSWMSVAPIFDLIIPHPFNYISRSEYESL